MVTRRRHLGTVRDGWEGARSRREGVLWRRVPATEEKIDVLWPWDVAGPGRDVMCTRGKVGCENARMRRSGEAKSCEGLERRETTWTNGTLRRGVGAAKETSSGEGTQREAWGGRGREGVRGKCGQRAVGRVGKRPEGAAGGTSHGNGFWYLASCSSIESCLSFCNFLNLASVVVASQSVTYFSPTLSGTSQN